MSDLLDLSHASREGMLVGGEQPPPRFNVRTTPRPEHGFTILVTEYSSASHVGTHVDSPRHFYEDGARLEELPLEAFCGEAVLVEVAKAPGQPVTVADIEGARPGPRRGDILLLKTGWWRHYRPERAELYRDHPYLEEAAADWIVGAGLKMVGTDTMSPDLPPARRPVAEYSLPVHRTLLGAGVLIAENLNLEHVGPGRYEVFAFPLVLPNGDGGPARIVARRL